jgi:hypothetical protein
VYEVPAWSTAAQLRTALALLMGVLGDYEKDAIALRGSMDNLLAKLNPPGASNCFASSGFEELSKVLQTRSRVLPLSCPDAPAKSIFEVST